jgi:hypothetical protein
MTTKPTVTTDQPTTSALVAGRQPHTAISPRRPWLVGVDPLAVTWWALLLAIAPAPLTAVAAFAPAALARAAAAAAIVVLVAGIVGGILHTGLFFVPALVVLVIGSRDLWRARHMHPA